MTVDVIEPQNTGDAQWVKNHLDYISNDHFGNLVDFLNNGDIAIGAADQNLF